MQRIVLFLMALVPLLGIGQDFKTQWDDVDRLISIKNYQQTQPILAAIKSKAEAESNAPEWVRAVLAEHHARTVNMSSDSTFYDSQQHLQTHIELAPALVEREVLQNTYASFLASHLYDRRVEAADGFLTWEIDKRKPFVDSIFRRSLKHASSLLNEPVEKWKTIISDLKNRTLAPSIYHLLAYNYLDFLETHYAEEKIKQEPILLSLQEINTKRTYTDAAAYLAFRPYISQGMWQIRNNEPAIEKILSDRQTDYNAHIFLVLANTHKIYGENKKAMKFIDTALELYPKSPWIDDVRAFRKELIRATLSLEVPGFSLTEQYIPIRISALNTDRAFIRVYKLHNTPANFRPYQTKYDSISNQVSLDANLVYQEEVNLKSFDDYKLHATNFKINPLPFGNYRILVANNPDFKDDGQELDVSETDFVVSNVFVSPTIDDRGRDDNGVRYTTLVVNRKDGTPYRNRKLNLYHEDKHILTKSDSLQTNKNGEFGYVDNDANKNIPLEDLMLYIPEEKQLISLNYLNSIPQHTRYLDEDQQPEKRALLFTDRAIYRPGQEVFFKAIVYSNDLLKGKVVPDQSVQIIYKDANHQPIDTLDLTTNTFGSVDGRFRLPKKTLNGVFRLEIYKEGKQLAQNQFSVEEYKRPTFKVSFDRNTHTYSKKDTAVFSGTAESLSGTTLASTVVKYTVSFYDTRTYQKINYRDSVTTTDAEGRFTLRVPLMDTVFQHQSDFTLQLHAEAINETGEIQTATGSYSYSDRPLRIGITVPGSTVEGTWKNVIITTSNPNGTPLPATGQVNIYRYEDPNIIKGNRKTFDFRTEYHILDTADYEKYFPWYFDKLDIMSTRPKTLVGSYTFSSEGTDTIRLEENYRYGTYLLEAFSVQGADTIQANETINLLSKENHKLSDKDFLVVETDKLNYTLGEKTLIRFQTDFDDAGGVYIWKIQGSSKSAVDFLPFKKGRTSYSYLISEDDIKESTWFEAMMVQDNKIVTRRIDLPIVQSDRSLDIQVRTFRNKITPGQKEIWSFTVKGKDKAIHAEVLASMYDTSLDRFARHDFPAAFLLGDNRRWYALYSGWGERSFSYTSSGNTLFYRPFDGYSLYENPPILVDYGLLQNALQYVGVGVRQQAMRRQVTEETAALDEVVVTGVAESATPQLQGKVAGITIRGNSSMNNQLPLYVIDGEIRENFDPNQLNANEFHNMKVLKGAEAAALYGTRGANGIVLITTKEGHQINQLDQVQARTNLQETAFFYPTLLTDNEENVTFEFESPEALTRWRLMLFAHTDDLKSGNASLFTQTQKPLMVRPNLPRFLREGDEIVIKAQIQNLNDSLQNGSARLEIINPENNAVISGDFFADNGLRDFTVDAKGNSTVSWTLRIPEGYPTVRVKIVGATADFSDGEMHELAILPNRMLLTDTRKIILEAGQRQDWTIPTKGKDNLQTHIQVQSNPILEIISALDYLKNYPYECNEQTASKWYGLQMLQYIKIQYPAIPAYLQAIDPIEVDSKLEDNSKLSELLTEEMPWVRQIQQDKDRLKSLSKLFHSDIASEIVTLEQKLGKGQLENGAFSWFEGGKADSHMSIRLLDLLGKVGKLDGSLLSENILSVSDKLIQYLDQDSAIYGKTASTGIVLDYLYARALWNDRHVLPALQTEQLRRHIDLSATYTAQQPAGLAAKAWLVNALYDYRIASLEVKNRITQEVIYDQQRGMYWESNQNRYNAMSLQSYLVEAYQQLDSTKLDLITQWIYYSKQQNNWLTTWNTADAVYALLLANNPRDFALDNTVNIWIDGQAAVLKDNVLGEVSTTLGPDKLNTDKTIEVTNNNNRKIYGGIYHQYFAPLDEVKSQQNALSVSKKLFVQQGSEWVESSTFKTGDKIKVQLVVVNNEALSYVHLRDSRAAGFEPVYQASGYQFWKGYYFTIKDASTNYFFDYLPKGRHVYEYEVKTNNNGVFSSGIAQIESMYDPTVNARSGNTTITIQD